MLNRRSALSVGSARPRPPGRLPTFRRAFARVADSALALDKLNDFYLSLPSARDPAQFVDATLANLGVTARLAGAGLDTIPASGPAIVVANHPFGGLDGLLLAQVLLKRRPDVRILTNRFLSVIPELAELFINVDVFRGRDGIRDNVGGVRKALRWVQSGGVLAMFPSGEVSHLKIEAGGIIDPVWPDSAARIVRMSRAQVIPVHFDGHNSWLFQIAGLLHPLLRTALLPRELLNKQRRQVLITLGSPIAAGKIASIEKDDVLAGHLRLQTYSLAPVANPVRLHEVDPESAPAAADIVAPVDPVLLAAQVDALPPAQRLASSGELTVLVARAAQAPAVLAEIGRLREVTFRAVGEGTGRSSDIDDYDTHYEHLFIWNGETREIVGAYRIGRSDEILKRRGLGGLYTHSLFRFSRRFFGQLRPALELGRSFVRAEYQRSFAPLLLLWKGIAVYVARHPRYSVLFGAVSISNDYHPLSKELVCEFLSREHFAADLARFVKPRNQVRRRFSLKTLLHPWDGPASIDSLGEVVSRLEPDGKGIPVLLRQYLKLGGRIVGFNVDPAFSDSIDCLLVVDLCDTDPRVLEKYMGKSAALDFARFHGEGSQAVSA
jgi:putative hemolysin